MAGVNSFNRGLNGTSSFSQPSMSPRNNNIPSVSPLPITPSGPPAPTQNLNPATSAPFSQKLNSNDDFSSQMIMGVIGIVIVLIIGFFMFLSSSKGEIEDKKIPVFKVNERMIEPVKIGINQIETPKLTATIDKQDAVFQKFVEGSKITVEFVQKEDKPEGTGNVVVKAFEKSFVVEWLQTPSYYGKYTVVSVDPKVGGAVEVIPSRSLLETILDPVKNLLEKSKSYIFKNPSGKEKITEDDFFGEYGESQEDRVKRLRLENQQKLDSYFVNLVKNYKPSTFFKIFHEDKTIEIIGRKIRVDGETLNVIWKGDSPSEGTTKIESVQLDEEGVEFVGGEVVLENGKIFLNFAKPSSADLSRVTWPNGEEAFPSHWGVPPAIESKSWVNLPGGYGSGSSTLAIWITNNMQRDAGKEAVANFVIQEKLNQECELPLGWCNTQDNRYYRRLDCDGNGIDDHYCFTPDEMMNGGTRKIIRKSKVKAVDIANDEGKELKIEKLPNNKILFKINDSILNVKWEGTPPNLTDGEITGTIESADKNSITLDTGKIVTNPFLLAENNSYVTICESVTECNNSAAANLETEWNSSESTRLKVLSETPCPRPDTFCDGTNTEYSFEGCDASGKYHMCKITDEEGQITYQKLKREKDETSDDYGNCVIESGTSSICPGMFSCRENAGNKGCVSKMIDGDPTLCNVCNGYKIDSYCDADSSCEWIGPKTKYCTDCIAADGVKVCKPPDGTSECFKNGGVCEGCDSREDGVANIVGADPNAPGVCEFDCNREGGDLDCMGVCAGVGTTAAVVGLGIALAPFTLGTSVTVAAAGGIAAGGIATGGAIAGGTFGGMTADCNNQNTREGCMDPSRCCKWTPKQGICKPKCNKSSTCMTECVMYDMEGKCGENLNKEICDNQTCCEWEYE